MLILGVPFNLTPDAIHKRDKFSKTLLEKGLEFVLCEEVGSISLSSSFILLSPEIDFFSEEQARKKYAFMALSTSHFEMILVLPAEVVVFHVQAPIV